MSDKTYRNLKSSNRLLVPVIMMMGFVPLLVHMFTYRTGLSAYSWFPDSGETQTEFFFGFKMVAIILLGVVMAGILLYRHFAKREKLKFENAFYLLLLYAVFVIMSALFSPYKYQVSHGTYELLEPVWVVFVYMLLCYYTYHYVQEEKQLDVIIRWVGIGMAVVTIIGAFQTFGLDFFQSHFGKMLITNPDYWDKLDQLNFTMAPKTAYTTLYNPNFLSFYYGMIIPLAACLLWSAKKVWQKVLFAGMEILALICLKGSGSDSGWMALAAGIVLLALVLLSRRKKLWYAGVGVVVIGIIGVVIVLNTTTVGKNIKNTIVGTYHMKDHFAINGIETTDENVVFDIRGNHLEVSYQTGDDGVAQISCKDADGNELTRTTTDEENYISVIDDARFCGTQVQPVSFGDDLPAMSVTIDGVAWNFIHTENGYEYLNPAGKLVKYGKVKSADVFHEDAMSKRGRIWNLTIPLLGKHILFGSGANTFMLEYPQNDYIYNAYNSAVNNFDVKAHCWYLQQWVENGLFGLLLLIGFTGWYLVRSVRIYRRADLHNRMSLIGFGLFGAVLIYMIAAVANDSNVCTAPVFWGVLGLGFAVNRMVVKEQNLFS